VELIAAQLRGESLEPLLRQHNDHFGQSYQRWFEAIYKDKYEYLGEYDLMRIAFQMDLGLYYLGIVSQPFKFGAGALRFPPFAARVSAPVFAFMSFYNRRFAALARDRRRRRELGLENNSRRFLFQSFSLSPKDLPRVLMAASDWLRLELSEGWRTWFGDTQTAPAPAPESNRAASLPKLSAE
jgi:hypothetical protein